MTQKCKYKKADSLGTILEAVHHVTVNTRALCGYFRHIEADGGEPSEGKTQEKTWERRNSGKSKTLMGSMQNSSLKIFITNKERRIWEI